MGFVTLSSSVVFVGGYPGRAAEGAAQNVTNAVAYEALQSRFAPGPYQRAQLDGVEKKPASETRQAALRNARAEEDEAFKLLEQLMLQANAAVSRPRVKALDSGAIADGDVLQTSIHGDLADVETLAVVELMTPATLIVHTCTRQA